jgi:teichuronic acid exporter
VWSGADVSIRQLLQFVVSIALARLLGPSEFGLLAMLYFFVGVGAVLIDGGFGAALVQRQSTTREEESSVFFLSAGMGLVAALALGLSGPSIAKFFRQPALGPLAWLMGLNLLFAALGCVPSALLTRALDFRTQMKAAVIATAVSGVVAVLVAWARGGVWALALQQVIGTAMTVALLWRFSAWRPILAFDRHGLAGMFGFGGFMLLSGILDQAFQRGSAVVIGRCYGAVDLGFFTRAESTRQVPLNVITGVVNRVALPAFSEIAGDLERLRESVRRALEGMMLVNIPLMLGTSAVAEPLVITLFGERWRPSISLLRILSLAGLFWPLHTVNLNALIALGRSREFFRLELAKKTIGLLLLLLSAPLGVVAMAWSQVALGAAAFVINAHFSRVHLNYGAGSQARAVMPFLGVGLGMAAAVAALDHGMGNAPPTVRLIAGVAVGAAFYVAACWILRLAVFLEAGRAARALWRRDAGQL